MIPEMGVVNREPGLGKIGFLIGWIVKVAVVPETDQPALSWMIK